MTPPPDALVARQNALIFRNARIAQVVNIVNASLLAWIASPTVAARPLAVWWVLLVATAVGRFVMAMAYDRATPEQQLAQAPRWQGRLRLGALAAALAWSGSGPLLMASGDVILQLFTALVLAGMVAGAIPLLGADRISFRLFGWPIAVAAAIGCLGPDPLHITFFAMAAIFILTATRSADNLSQALVDTLRLELEKSELVDNLRQAMVRVTASDRAKSEFLATISHELRTPLNGIIGFADLLDQERLPPHQQELLAPLRQSADHLLALIDNLIDLSALEAGHIRLNPSAFAVSELLDAFLNSPAQQARRKGLDFITEADPRLPPVVIGDMRRLRQTLLHLVDNAIKFTDRGAVTVSLHQLKRTSEQVEVAFEVGDTGIGIAPAQLERIFSPFVQGDGSTTRRHGGSGIGLPIAHRLVALMGGEMTVTSQLGQGTTFRLTLPFALPADHPQTQPVPLADPAARF